MRILLNGEPQELPEPRTVQQLLDDLGLDPRVVAVEVNRVVIRRDRHSGTQIPDGAEVEIVSFVGGGSAGSCRRALRPRRRLR